MVPMTSNSFLMMEKTMGFLWQRQSTILNNIANAETPNYKAKDVTFEEVFRRQLTGAAGTTRPRAAVRGALDSSFAVTRDANESTRMDGNGVNATEESLELARTGYQMQYMIQSINTDLGALRTAIRGQ